MKRIVIGKGLGFLFGLLAFFVIPMVLPDVSMMMRVGVLLWYTMMGAMIGVFGVMDYHPILKMRMPAWFRGVVIGGSMNLILLLIAYDALEPHLVTATVFTNISPFWIVFEGAVLGLIIDMFITKKTGEGASLCAQ
jgi:hypothetical protein